MEFVFPNSLLRPVSRSDGTQDLYHSARMFPVLFLLLVLQHVQQWHSEAFSPVTLEKILFTTKTGFLLLFLPWVLYQMNGMQTQPAV